MTESNHHYNKGLKHFARQLRSNETQAEKQLWYQVLRSKQMLGYQFLRQRAIDKYIADFMCKDLMLIIELDGFTHSLEETAAKDVKKQQDLEELGYTVLHFNDEQVMNDLHNVTQAIEGWILNYKESLSSPE